MALLARMVGRDEMFAPVLDPLDRPAQAHRRHADQDVLRIELAADPKTSANMKLMQMK